MRSAEFQMPALRGGYCDRDENLDRQTGRGTLGTPVPTCRASNRRQPRLQIPEGAASCDGNVQHPSRRSHRRGDKGPLRSRSESGCWLNPAIYHGAPTRGAPLKAPARAWKDQTAFNIRERAGRRKQKPVTRPESRSKRLRYLFGIRGRLERCRGLDGPLLACTPRLVANPNIQRVA